MELFSRSGAKKMKTPTAIRITGIIIGKTRTIWTERARDSVPLRP